MLDFINSLSKRIAFYYLAYIFIIHVFLKIANRRWILLNTFIQIHNTWILNTQKKIDQKDSLTETDLEYHVMKVSYLQHERLIHLLILIFTGMTCITFFVLSLFTQEILLHVLVLITTVMVFFYIKHYFLLENTVQKWYTFSDQLYCIIKYNQ